MCSPMLLTLQYDSVSIDGVNKIGSFGWRGLVLVFLGCVGLGVYLFCCWLFVDLLLFVVVVFQRYKVAHQRNKQPFIYIPVDDKSYKPS